METLPSTLGDQIGPEHNSDDSSPFLHHGHLAPHDIAEDQQSACRLHCCIAWLELGAYVLLRREAWTVQGRTLSSYVRCQPGVQLAIHGGKKYCIWLVKTNF